VSKHHNVPIIGQGGIMTAGEFTNWRTMIQQKKEKGK
jgi:hypothetical protein